MNEVVNKAIGQCLANFGRDLLGEIAEFGIVRELPPNEFIIKQGQFVRYLPVVITGVVKVYSEEKDDQFLLYYIYPGSTCIFSFANLFGNKQVTFSGITELKTLLLLIPVDKAREWLLKYPVFNEMVLHEYQKQYDDLLHTTKQIMCYNLEERVLVYLKTKAQLRGSNIISISHRDIADDLATTREVISRLLRKMEKDNKVSQQGRKIKIL